MPQATMMTTPEVISASQSIQVPEVTLECVSVETQTVEVVQRTVTDSNTAERVKNIVHSIGLPIEVENFICGSRLSLQHSGPPLQMHGSHTSSWDRHYSVLSFLLNGHLYVEYDRLRGMLGLPSCSKATWQKIVEGLQKHVTGLAKWSCIRVRDAIRSRGDHQKWTASFDGFYLTRGHHSNNSSATLHDYRTGKIAWLCHRTKQGPGHNWEGTSGGAEGDMFNELLGKAKDAGFIVS